MLSVYGLLRFKASRVAMPVEVCQSFAKRARPVEEASEDTQARGVVYDETWGEKFTKQGEGLWRCGAPFASCNNNNNK
jgi:hypothetical protein